MSTDNVFAMELLVPLCVLSFCLTITLLNDCSTGISGQGQEKRLKMQGFTLDTLFFKIFERRKIKTIIMAGRISLISLVI